VPVPRFWAADLSVEATNFIDVLALMSVLSLRGGRSSRDAFHVKVTELTKRRDGVIGIGVDGVIRHYASQRGTKTASSVAMAVNVGVSLLVSG
jgi:pentose-5-phosphate-3-epimerase